MTVTVTTARVEYTGNGSTTAFTVPFYFLANGDLKVYQAGTLKTITTHYTVSGAGNPAGGTVTFGTAPTAGQSVVIFRDPAITQSTDYTPNDPFPAESHERALDRLTMIAQRLDDRVDRALTLADSDTSGASTTLPTPEASQLIGWNEDADALMNYDPTDIASVVTYSNWKVQTFTGDGSETEFTLTDSPVNVANTDVSIDGVTQVPGADYSLSGDGMSIVFGTAPGNGTVICVRYGQSAAQGRDDASIIYWTQSGTGAVSRSVQATLRDTVSVEDFGAVGDGSTDDAIAINAAITAVNAAGGGVVLLNAKNYLVTSPILLKSNVTLKGKGFEVTTITQGGSVAEWAGVAGSAGVITTASANEYEDIHIIGLTLQGLYLTPVADGAPNYAKGGIALANVWNSSVQDCYVADTGTGINVYGTVTGVVNYNNFISNCTVRRASSWQEAGNPGTPRGILMDTDNSTVKDCVSDDSFTGFFVGGNYNNYINCRTSEWTDDGFYINANYCTFTNCYAIGDTTRAGASGSGFAVNPSVGHTFVGCVALRCPNAGIRFRHAGATAPYNCRVIGCWFSDCGYGYLDDMTGADPYPDATCHGNVFIGNVADTCQSSGFRFQQHINSIIKGNTAYNNNQAGVTAQTRGGISLTSYCLNNVVQGNVCYDDQGAPTQTFGLYSYLKADSGASVENTGNRYEHTSISGTDLYYPTYQKGTASATVANGTRKKTGSVTFAQAFEAAPVVTLSVQNGTTLDDAERPVSVCAYSVTATGFSYVVDCVANVASDRAVSIGWDAVA